MSNRGDANRLALEESPIGPAIQLLMDHCLSGRWSGTVSELLESIERYADETTKRRKDWPDSIPKLSAKLWRLAPVLRQQGIDVAQMERAKDRRGLILTKISDAPQMQEVCGETVSPVTASPIQEEDMPF